MRRTLTIELLEDRRVLAGNLYGVDFGTNFDAPSNFMGLTEAAIGQTFEDVRESGFSLTLDGFAQEFDTEDTAPDPATVPTNVLSIEKIGGLLKGTKDTNLGRSVRLDATWGNLNPSSVYEIYVFGLGVRDFASAAQDVIIGGLNTVSFTQGNTKAEIGESSPKLWVNGSVGRDGDLGQFAEFLTPDEQSEISISVVHTTAIGVAGFAIRDTEGILVNSLAQGDDGDPNNGITTPEEAFNIANATPGHDTIYFAPFLSGGVFKPNAPLPISDSVTISGATLSDPITFDGQNKNEIFQIAAGNFNVVFDKVILANGLSPDSEPGSNIQQSSDGIASGLAPIVGGAAISSQSTGTLVVKDSWIHDNRTEAAVAQGGAIHHAGDIFIDRSLLEHNSTAGNSASGGAAAALGTLTVTDSTIRNNRTEGGNSSGGGLYAEGHLTVSDSRIENNSAQGFNGNGGGIQSVDGATIAESQITGNRSEMGSGGGLINFGSLEVDGTDISGNYAYVGGGGINTFGGQFGSTTISGSTISNNMVEGSGFLGGGGGIQTSSSPLTITQSTISGNRVTGGNSANGGGILTGANAVFDHTTITDNYAAGTGGLGGGVAALYNGQDITLNNTIVAGNTAVGGSPDIKGSDLNGTITANYSLVGDAAGAVVAINGGIVGDSTGSGVVDPQLKPLDNNGGPLLTHAPMPGSPAIDAGDPNAMAGDGSTPLFDQRGNPFERIVDGDQQPPAIIDIGSYEVGAGVPTFPGDYNRDGSVNAADYPVYRRSLGSMTDLRADGNGNGMIDPGDYDVWRENFGNQAPPVTTVTGTGSTSTLLEAIAQVNTETIVGQAGPENGLPVAQQIHPFNFSMAIDEDALLAALDLAHRGEAVQRPVTPAPEGEEQLPRLNEIKDDDLAADVTSVDTILAVTFAQWL